MKLEKAIKIAVEAHTGQVDKGGNPYILHPLRVMLSLNTEEERIVGVLHDVVEDCAPTDYIWDREDFSHFHKLSQIRQPEKNTWEYLISEGLNERLFEALQSVSKSPKEEADFQDLKQNASEEALRQHYIAFINRALGNEIGRKVKLKDIDDNLDVSRIASPTENDKRRLRRYKEARRILALGKE